MTPPSCSLVERWIYLALDGELSPECERQLEAHLDLCENCRRRFEEAMRGNHLLDKQLQNISASLDELLEGRIDQGSIADFERRRLLAQRRGQGVPILGTLRTKRGLLALAAALVILVLGGLLFFGHRPPPEPQLGYEIAQVSWEGSGVRITSPEGGTRALPDETSSALLAGDVVRAAPDTRVVVLLHEGSEVRFDAGSSFSVRPMGARGSPPRFDLLRGGGSFHVLEGHGGLRVDTAYAEITDVGTRFSVRQREDLEATEVTVYEGVVQVRHRGSSTPAVDVVAGDVVRVTPSTIHFPKLSPIRAPKQSVDQGARPVQPPEVRTTQEKETRLDEQTEPNGRHTVPQTPSSRGLDLPREKPEKDHRP